jgi:predicted nucleic acid-binding protein
LIEQPHCQIIVPGTRHWNISCDLCSQLNIKGDLIPDAWFAALAIESGCEWITLDRDFARFDGLRWRPPF